MDTSVSPRSNLLNPCSNGNSTSSLSKIPPTATTTALMMINKHYSNHSSSSLPSMSDPPQASITKNTSFYDKRHSNDA